MEANGKVVCKLLEELGLEATSEAESGIVSFAVLFADKMVRNCLIRKHSHSHLRRVNVEDVRRSYELINKLHGGDFEEELKERKKAMIKSINTTVNFEEQPAKSVVTVNLYPSELQHMLTNKEQQLAFD